MGYVPYAWYWNPGKELKMWPIVNEKARLEDKFVKPPEEQEWQLDLLASLDVYADCICHLSETQRTRDVR